MYNHVNSTDCVLCHHKEVCSRKENFQRIQKEVQELYVQVTVEKPWISYGGIQCQSYSEVKPQSKHTHNVELPPHTHSCPDLSDSFGRSTHGGTLG
jgi:hypothetical protein